MRNDNDFKYEYTKYTSKPVGSEVKEKMNKKNHQVYVMNAFTIEDMIHESRHGGDNARGEKYGIKSEIEAYKAQFGYSGQIEYYTNHILQFVAIDNCVGLSPSKITDYYSINTYFINNIIELVDVKIDFVYKFNSK